jgi:rod shape-determining protein MreC
VALQRRTRSTRLLVITLITASLVTITVDYKEGNSGPLAEIGKGALTVIAPMQDAVSKVFRPVSRFFSSLADLPSLRNQNEQLRNEIAQLKTQVQQSTSLQELNRELSGLIHIQSTLLTNQMTTGANVIGSGVSNFEWNITIDKGSGAGVKMDDAVVAANGIVGHVVDVTPTSSVVQLIVDPGSSVAARLIVSRQAGLLQGRGSSSMFLATIPAGTPIEKNEGVETAGYQNGLYPPGVPIGTVSSVQHIPGELTENVFVHPAVDFSTLDYVLVVLGPRSR